MALGVGLVVRAKLKRKSENDSLKLRCDLKASRRGFLSMSLPLWLRNPWFARVFNIGHGARTSEAVSIEMFELGWLIADRTITRTCRAPMRINIIMDCR